MVRFRHQPLFWSGYLLLFLIYLRGLLFPRFVISKFSSLLLFPGLVDDSELEDWVTLSEDYAAMWLLMCLICSTGALPFPQLRSCLVSGVSTTVVVAVSPSLGSPSSLGDGLRLVVPFDSLNSFKFLNLALRSFAGSLMSHLWFSHLVGSSRAT